ncbi:toxin-antitoxin system HicB family antitoxin [Roseibacillus ishigakijimensis]|uniref:Toxin-antitoxin system HicB family antitoxin n=1 Tax=Roseibacillus ishigakijimensis TaxID=454146 RepID=A0A934RUK1_9BACT|nr:toxin-antitoxin system HicB family antitoxin [Roseibacillus ishigakijimensis]MBK1834435.1 toxin-antitoxin system HicB family antitoxin [Roseibacillus ishigakijimensis]
MATLSIRIPDSLHQSVKEMAENDHVSLNQFIALTLTEKVSTLRTIEQLKAKATRANLADFDQLLSRVPDVEPDEKDRLPEPQ